MKKILFVNDSNHFSRGSLEFIRQLNQFEPILVTGIFMPQSAFASVLSYAASANGLGNTGYFPSVESDEVIQIEGEMKKFENFCLKNDLLYRLHRDTYNVNLPQLRLESRFADLMVISSELFYKKSDASEADFEHIRDTIRTSECPVIVVPENFIFPESVILAYDGTEESVYAIKQFAYLFPKLGIHPTLLVYADENENSELPSEDYIRELAAQHYPDLTLYKLGINPKNHFADWVKGRKGSVLVCGSLGRSGLSNFFRKSFAAEIIRSHELPVFVATRKR